MHLRFVCLNEDRLSDSEDWRFALVAPNWHIELSPYPFPTQIQKYVWMNPSKIANANIARCFQLLVHKDGRILDETFSQQYDEKIL